ncbi:unnamed protein product [Staurois parvus]|uniref:Uncharacterized protein n=1 Tax=Staurois parvus TaxID=386267 RepID=A0ABN9FU52_9NEOB|nr:unnamed protein product [Staurois parvus]
MPLRLVVSGKNVYSLHWWLVERMRLKLMISGKISPHRLLKWHQW